MTADADHRPSDPAFPADDGLGLDDWRGWFDAARTKPVDQGIRAIWADLTDAVAARAPVCWASGRCCHFNAFGHRLYVTALETAWLLSQPELADRPLDPAAIDPAGACPFQVDSLCSVHAVRPLGCRIFFCQRGSEAWQHDLYETMLDRLRRLHEAHSVTYRYLEWRVSLTTAACAMQALRT